MKSIALVSYIKEIKVFRPLFKFISIHVTRELKVENKKNTFIFHLGLYRDEINNELNPKNENLNISSFLFIFPFMP